MKTKNYLLIFASILLFNCCIHPFNPSSDSSGSIEIETTAENFENDYKIVRKVIEDISFNKGRISNELYEKYPDVAREFIDNIQFSTVTRTISKVLDINNKINTSETSRLSVEILLKYNEPDEEQAQKVISFYKTLVTDELGKHDIKTIPHETCH